MEIIVAGLCLFFIVYYFYLQLGVINKSVDAINTGMNIIHKKLDALVQLGAPSKIDDGDDDELINKNKFNDILAHEIFKIQHEIAKTRALLLKDELQESERESWALRYVYRFYPKSVAFDYYGIEDGPSGQIFLDFTDLPLGLDGWLGIDSIKLIAANSGYDKNETPYILKKGVTVGAYIFEEELINATVRSVGNLKCYSDYMYRRWAKVVSVKKERDGFYGYDNYLVTLKIDLNDSLNHTKYAPASEKIITRTITITENNPFPCVADDENMLSKLKNIKIHLLIIISVKNIESTSIYRNIF